MKEQLTPHIDEKYRCTHCKKEFDFCDVHTDWKCPGCKNPISIKVKMEEFIYSCHRLKPADIETSYSMTFNRKTTHEIINVTRKDNLFRVALKGHGILDCKKETFLLVINGGWYD